MWERVVLNAVSLLIGLGALAVAVWALTSKQAQEQGMDGLFLVLVCLLIAVGFSLGPVREIRRGLLRELLKQHQSKAADEEGQAVAGMALQETRDTK